MPSAIPFAARSTRLAAGLLLILAALIASLPSPIARADTIPTQETSLAAGGTVYEVNRGGETYVYVSDSGAGEIWVVTAATGAYTRYTGLAGATDARPESDGDVWWTDSGTKFGRVNAGAGTVTRWNLLDLDPQGTYDLGGLALDANGVLWMTESFGSTSKLWQFTPGSAQLCYYGISGGTVSQYVAQRDGALWFANWSNDRLVRFSPGNNQLNYWKMPAGFMEGLALDAAGNVWAADSSAGDLYRYEPGANRLTTYGLPSGTTPHVVAPSDAGIWYSEGSGTVGYLDPTLATGSASTPAAGFQNVNAPTCVSFGSGATTAVSKSTGNLAWTASSWTTVAAPAGWQLYDLPDSSTPYGIAPSAGYVWVGDQGRQKLIRLAWAPDVDIAQYQTTSVRLEWTALSGATSYQVWRSALPFFQPGDSSSPTPAQDSTATSYVHGGAFTSTSNYYYVVRSISGGQPSANSNRTGKFTFTLTPGGA
jgi:streptogramin lyase